jgi:hypothetical protein
VDSPSELGVRCRFNIDALRNQYEICARLQLMADDSFNRKELESDPHYTREAAAAWVDSHPP